MEALAASLPTSLGRVADQRGEPRERAARRILLVDDQPLFAEALATVLADQPDLKVVGYARTCGEALAGLNTWHPDLLLLDVEISTCEGLDLVSRLLDCVPSVLVAVLTETEEIEVVVEALRRGIAAWIPKSEPVSHLLGVIRGLKPGDCYLPPRLLGHAVRALVTTGQDGPLAILTPREHEVLQCMVDGSGRDEVAARLYLSPNTVRTHTQNVLAKLGVHSVVEAVALGMRCGLRPSTIDRS